MTQYIDKDTLVAEINRLIKKNELYLDENASDEVRFQKTGAYSVLCDLRHFLNTLEVKEVDLEKEIKRFTMSKELYEADSVIKAVAEHFFELGLKAKEE